MSAISEENARMFNKKRLIIAGVLVVVTTTIVIALAIVAVILFRSSGDTVAVRGPTAVGAPNGPATTKSIGPAGGSIASPDGRITINVPPNTVTSPVDFSIQPITNLAHGGSGTAYRLEPSGLKFAEPVKVSFKPDAQDLEGTMPEAFTVAYQDPTGVWQVFRTANIDPANKTLTVSTTHFTDYSLWTFQLSPKKATLYVGETQVITLVGCYREGGAANTIRRWLGAGPLTCETLNVRDSSSWDVNYGTIVPSGDSKNSSALYTAPAKKPRPNVATVRFVYGLRFSGEDMKTTTTAEITILDRGYRASGQQDGPVVYSGVVCDLESPFTLTGTHPQLVYTYKFNPSSATSGTASLAASGGGVIWGGTGPYRIEGIDTPQRRIVWNVSTTVNAMGRKASGSGIAYIWLTPLDTEECNK
jgi:hypothetical protein